MKDQSLPELWTSKECAQYLKLSQRQFVERTSKHSTFPKPFKLPAGDSQTNRWNPTEIIEWVTACR